MQDTEICIFNMIKLKIKQTQLVPKQNSKYYNIFNELYQTS